MGEGVVEEIVVYHSATGNGPALSGEQRENFIAHTTQVIVSD